MCTLDDIETDISYFGHIDEDYQKLKSKIAYNHFRLDDVTKEKKISDCVSEMVYTKDELQDASFDLAILKTL